MSTLTLLCIATALLVQEAPTSTGPDLSLLQPIHDSDLADRPRGPRAPFVTYYRDGDRELVFIAAKHERSIDSPTHRLVKDVIENYKPAFVIAEGWPTSNGISPPRMIQQMQRRVETGQMGESPYAALLAHRQGVDFIGGEPDIQDQCDALVEQGFEPDDILAFIALRSALAQVDRGDPDAIPTTTQRAIKRFARPLGVEPPSWEEIELWHQENLGRELVIEDLRKSLIAPRVRESMTILNKIGIAIELIRETNIINVESEMLAKYKRILVVYGSGHLNYERAVLADWLGEPRFSSRAWPSDGPEPTPTNAPATGESTPPQDSQIEPAPIKHEQLSQFVRRIFQDDRGDLWFGTNGDGVLRYDGETLDSFSLNEGFGGVAVRAIVQDEDGDVWFGTERGITRHDGTSFHNFTEKDGLINGDVWSVAIDSKGIIWIGTLQGVSRFDGTEFTTFPLPESKPDPMRGVTSAKIVHCIMEDRKGRMWFGTGGGAYCLDGTTLTNISKKDGLCHDSVNCILEARDGSMWFATHHNGVCRFDGTSFTHFTTKHGVEGHEAWNLYEDSSGNIWFPIENSGVYRYDGKSFTRFDTKQGLTSNAVQCAFEDKEGRIWLGGYMGLFRYDGDSILKVGKNGPWE